MPSRQKKIAIFQPALSNNEESGTVKDIHNGLNSTPKDLSLWPKYLYNSVGSDLFDEITEQIEYYQTRTELAILREFSEKIVGGSDLGELVELGSGSSRKTIVLVEEMIKRYGWTNVRYVPLDVSKKAVEEGTDSLKYNYPGLDICGYIGDFDGSVEEFLSSLPRGFGNRIVILLGGTIGNFTPQRRKEFLESVRASMTIGDRFLVGVDLVKDTKTLESAYDDAAGVTAAFNKNILSSINESIGSEFEPELFEHQVFYNEEEARIEMWLISKEEQEIALGSPALSAHFSKGEGVRTEISTKFTRASASNMFEGLGMRLIELYTDPDELFGIALAKPE